LACTLYKIQKAQEMVPFFNIMPSHEVIAAELAQATERVISSGGYILGTELENFETEFATYCNARHCVGVANGLDAITIALRAAGIGIGHEVIVPCHTFIATWLAIEQAGAKIVPVDIDPETYHIDYDQIEASVTPRTSAIVAVSLYGNPLNISALRRIADKHKLLLIDDAAQSHGSAIGGLVTGSQADVTTFSFYPTKNLGALGDAGALVTNSDEIARTARALRNYGSKTKYHHEFIAGNSRLDEIQAAYLRVKLRFLAKWNDERASIADRYNDLLAEIQSIVLPRRAIDAKHVYHLYVIATEQRDRLQTNLSTKGIQTLVHYPLPCHLQEAFAHLNLKRGMFPQSESAANTVLSLPVWPGMSDEMIRLVAEQVSASI
jgi:dTDP-4-amino-4,6-dideoxygalactose transaminase